VADPLGEIMTSDDDLKKFMNDPSRDKKMLEDHEPVVPLILTGFATATISPTDALMKLEVIVQVPQRAVTILPIAMSRTQCTELGQALLRLAVQTRNPKVAKN